MNANVKTTRAAYGGVSSPRAFTLIEVLAVLVLVAIVLPIAMKGVTLSMQTAARARQLTEAGQLASNKLNELVILKDPALFDSTGDFAESDEYRWASHSVARSTGLYEVSVRVAFVAQGLEQTVTISTLAAPDLTSTTTTASTPLLGVTP